MYSKRENYIVSYSLNIFSGNTMSNLHQMKKLKEENPGAWATLRGEISRRVNNNHDGKYTKEGEIKMRKAMKKKARR